MSASGRKVALDILSEVADGGAYLNLAIKKHLPRLISAEDRRFAAALVSTTVQNCLRIDYVIGQFVHTKRVHKVIRNILRIGVCQLMFFESVPVSAAVNESVKLAAESGKSQLKGFVNGVLRNVSGNLGSVQYPDRQKDLAEFLSVLYSYPKWLCEKFIREYGFDFTQEMLSYSADTTLTCVRVESNRLAEEDIKTADTFLPGKYFSDARYIKSASSIEDMPLYKKGGITPQGESSLLCVHAAGIKKADSVLDVCAAPGGKSAYAAGMCKNLVAMDLYPHRVELIRRTFKRLDVQNANALEGDGTVFRPDLEEKFDVVMMDAPCSALGLLYRKPDIKLHKKLEELQSLSEMQRALLSNCSRYVKKGGVLLYSTCTINDEENRDNAEWFLKTHPNFAADDFSGDIPAGLSCLVRDGMLQLFPQLSGIDGFFIARFRRMG